MLMTLSSNYITALPEDLKNAAVKATEKARRVIDNFSKGMQGWYILNGNNHHHWNYTTRKLIDPSWVGPKDGKLAVVLETTKENELLGMVINTNTWQSYTGRRPDTFFTVIKLPKAGLNSFHLSASDFKNDKGESLKDWDEITELSFTPSARLKNKDAPKQEWQGKAPTLKKLSWQEGKFIKRPYPHESRTKYPVATAQEFEDEFQKAIDDSVELEKKDEKLK